MTRGIPGLRCHGTWRHRGTPTRGRAAGGRAGKAVEDWGLQGARATLQRPWESHRLHSRRIFWRQGEEGLAGPDQRQVQSVPGVREEWHGQDSSSDNSTADDRPCSREDLVFSPGYKYRHTVKLSPKKKIVCLSSCRFCCEFFDRKSVA